jgi:uncharacterized protein (DUF362 family)
MEEAYHIRPKDTWNISHNKIAVGVVRKKGIIQSVKTSVDLAGGMKIKKNSTVLIRPNANTADYPRPAQPILKS